MVKKIEVWYQSGLRFKCTGCGQCCTGAPGSVWVSFQEIKTLADHLNISEEEFIRTYTHRIGNRISLREDPQTYDCVFLKGKRCEVYNVRPKQCQTFPWWPENLKSPAHWQEVKTRCEGIDHSEAPLISLEEIQKYLGN